MGEIVRIPVNLKYDTSEEVFWALVEPSRKNRTLTSFIQDMLKAYVSDEGVHDAVDSYRSQRDGFSQLKEHIQRLAELQGKNERMIEDMEQDMGINAINVWEEAQRNYDMEHGVEQSDGGTGTASVSDSGSDGVQNFLMVEYSAVPEVFRDVALSTSNFPIEPQPLGLPDKAYSDMTVEQMMPQLLQRIISIESDIRELRDDVMEERRGTRKRKPKSDVTNGISVNDSSDTVTADSADGNSTGGSTVVNKSATDSSYSVAKAESVSGYEIHNESTEVEATGKSSVSSAEVTDVDDKVAKGSLMDFMSSLGAL